MTVSITSAGQRFSSVDLAATLRAAAADLEAQALEMRKAADALDPPAEKPAPFVPPPSAIPTMTDAIERIRREIRSRSGRIRIGQLKACFGLPDAEFDKRIRPLLTKENDFNLTPNQWLSIISEPLSPAAFASSDLADLEHALSAGRTIMGD